MVGQTHRLIAPATISTAACGGLAHGPRLASVTHPRAATTTTPAHAAGRSLAAGTRRGVPDQGHARHARRAGLSRGQAEERRSGAVVPLRDRGKRPARGPRQRATALFLSPPARPLRVMTTGSLVAVVQYGLLALLTHQRVSPLLANALALLLAAQVNFVLSCLVSWHDRLPRGRVAPAILRRWIGYQGTTIGGGLLNLLVFNAACAALPVLGAAVVGNTAASVVNYVLNDRLVFR